MSETEAEIVSDGAPSKPPKKGLSLFKVLIILAALFLIASFISFLVYQSHFYTEIQSYEKGVLYTLGKASRTPLEPGPHWHLPAPIQRVDVVNVSADRRIQIGFRTSPNSTERKHIDEEALVLTRAGNLVDIEVEINYDISDVVDYVLNVQTPEETIRDAAESALKTIIGTQDVNDILTDKKSNIIAEIHQEIQEILNNYRIGVKISRVQIIRALNPLKVREAFESVESARKDSAIVVEEAIAYQNKELPDARAEAIRMKKEAEAYKVQRMKKAQAETEEFNSLLQNVKGSKSITKKRLYLETLEEVLPGKKKILVDEKGSALPLLNLKGLN
jgi:membrane protease subunit HflK